MVKGENGSTWRLGTRIARLERKECMGEVECVNELYKKQWASKHPRKKNRRD